MSTFIFTFSPSSARNCIINFCRRGNYARQLHISREAINTQHTIPDTTVQPYCFKKQINLFNNQRCGFSGKWKQMTCKERWNHCEVFISSDGSKSMSSFSFKSYPISSLRSVSSCWESHVRSSIFWLIRNIRMKSKVINCLLEKLADTAFWPEMADLYSLVFPAEQLQSLYIYNL